MWKQRPAEMPWFKVDDGFANSKPVLRIPRRYRAAAIGLWTLAGTWSAKELTDGFVPDYTLEDFCATVAIAGHLVKAGLWEESSSGWQFVGWSKYQFTKAKVLEHRAAESEKKRKWREAKQGIADQQESVVSPRDTLGDNAGTPKGTHAVSTSTRPDQTRPVLSLVTSGGEVTLVDDPEPPRFCEDHPDDTSDPCTPCRKSREAHNAWKDREPERTRLLAEARQRQRESCTRCEGTSTYTDADGETRKCWPHITEEVESA